VFDIGKIHEALLEALRCEECSFPTVSEISKRFECSQSVLYNHFPELCHELTKKHKSNRPAVRSPEKTARDLSMSEVEVMTDKPKRTRKIFRMEDIDKMRKELECLLENGNDRPFTMSKLAKHVGWSAKSLRDYFPELCDKIIKKWEKEEHLNKLRQALEEVLMGSGAPSVNQLAQQLGCSRAILRSHFPDLCTLISQRYWGLRDSEIQRNTLEELLRSGEGANLSINEIAKRLGCNSMTLHNRFPELCKTLMMRRWQTVDTAGMRQVLEAALANDEESPPTLQALSKVLGCSIRQLEYHFPEACHSITQRRRRLLGLGKFRQRLEEMLADDEPISAQTAATRLGCSASSLRNRFPELCKSISARYFAASKKMEEDICNEIREIVFALHAHGEYPAQEKVQGLVSKPNYFWRLKVRETWRNALRELGLSD